MNLLIRFWGLLTRSQAPTAHLEADHDDHLQDECAVVGYIGLQTLVAEILEKMLFALENRGRQGSGMCLKLEDNINLTAAYGKLFRMVLAKEINGRFQYGGRLRTVLEGIAKVALLIEIAIRWIGSLVNWEYPLLTRKGVGSVTQVYSDLYRRILFLITAKVGFGQNRYKTAGKSTFAELQPLVVRIGKEKLAVVHNGNLTNANELRASLKSKGAKFVSTSDSEVILHLVAEGMKDGLEFVEALKRGLSLVRGAYCYIFLWQGKLYAARDPRGFHPLSIGKIKGRGFVVASETGAFREVNAKKIRDVARGELVELDGETITTLSSKPAKRGARCLFNNVYIARGDSLLWSEWDEPVARSATTPWEDRYHMGYRLGLEEPKHRWTRNDTIVVGIPNSGLRAAEGYANATKLRSIEAITRNLSVRSFMADTQEERDFLALQKYNYVESLIRGKRVIVVDDSLVRGTTARRIVQRLIELGAIEVHFRFAAPAIQYCCFFGVDTPDRSHLIAANRSFDEIATAITAGLSKVVPVTVRLLTLEGIRQALRYDGEGFCEACLTGIYPAGSGVNSFIQIKT